MTAPDRPGSCRVCSAGITPFMSFGRMPIANAFLTADQIPTEYFFELAPAFCSQCATFQLYEQPPRERMFHGHYAFFSSTSLKMQEHFKAFADLVISRVLHGRPDPFVVELGCNDGIMLRHFKAAGYRHLGIEPSQNVAAVARSRGIETNGEFFDEALATRLLTQHGHADAIIAANVMCHIADVRGATAGIARLLAPGGVVMFEDPYLGDMIEKTSYDQIYDEHVFMFSASSVTRLLAEHGLELIDVLPQMTHGGSMRYVAARAGSQSVAPGVAVLLALEQQILNRPETYDRFRQNCESSRGALRELLDSMRHQGQRVAGYGATSKSTTVTNYCGIGPHDVEFIADTTPIKQGKLTPGTHIPVRPYEDFCRNPPDFALLFAWNHAEEILAKEQAFRSGGGRWITYVPRVGIID